MLKRFWGIRTPLLVALFAASSLACDLSAVLNAAVSSSTPAPSSSSSCPTFKSAKTTPPGFPIKLTMAESTRGTGKDPVGSTLIFSPTSVFHAVVAIENAPDDTEFTATWYALDTGGKSDCNAEIDSTALTSSGTRNLDFTMTPESKWPVGTFHVEIQVNGTPALVQNFSVK